MRLAFVNAKVKYKEVLPNLTFDHKMRTLILPFTLTPIQCMHTSACMHICTHTMHTHVPLIPISDSCYLPQTLPGISPLYQRQVPFTCQVKNSDANTVSISDIPCNEVIKKEDLPGICGIVFHCPRQVCIFSIFSIVPSFQG